MQSKFKSTIAVLLVAATASLAGSASASARNFGFELQFGSHQSSPQFRFHNVQPRYHHQKQSNKKRCRPQRALKKARNKFGVHHGQVTRSNKRKVVVRGYNYGHPVKLVFANRKGCPLIAYR